PGGAGSLLFVHTRQHGSVHQRFPTNSMRGTSRASKQTSGGSNVQFSSRKMGGALMVFHLQRSRPHPTRTGREFGNASRQQGSAPARSQSIWSRTSSNARFKSASLRALTSSADSAAASALPPWQSQT